MSDRPFRRPESYEAEVITRRMLPDFLRDRGFGDVVNTPERQGQTIEATPPGGQRLRMRVRQCWRRDTGGRDSRRARTYSAAQLLANIKGGDWVGSLRAKVERERGRGVTHLLFVQRDDKDIRYAALVPLAALATFANLAWANRRAIARSG